MFRTKKINSETVVAPKVAEEMDAKRIKGYSLFPLVYSNIYCCARTQSGKTVAIFHIIKKCVSNKTKVYIFCGTHDIDPTWILIKEWLTDKGVEFEAHKSIYDNDRSDIVARIIKEKQEPDENSEDDELDFPEVQPIFMSDYEEAKWIEKQEKLAEKRRKKKSGKSKIYNKNLFCFDDISSELKSPSVIRLLKEQRHYKSKTIISSQNFKDCPPAARGQFMYMLIFKGIRDDVLELIHKETYINIDLEPFLKIYKYATEKPFSFLYVDLRQMKFRKNFDEEIVPKKKDDTSEDENSD